MGEDYAFPFSDFRSYISNSRRFKNLKQSCSQIVTYDPKFRQNIRETIYRTHFLYMVFKNFKLMFIFRKKKDFEIRKFVYFLCEISRI